MNKRFEYLRAISITAVVVIHSSYTAITVFESARDSKVWLFYQIIVNLLLWAVPCFLMLTGTLLLNSEKKIDEKKLYGKYIFRMIAVLLTFGWGYSWLELFFSSQNLFDIKQIFVALLNVIQGQSWEVMWYIYCLLGIYLLLPLYKIIANFATDKEIKYILYILFFLDSIAIITMVYDVKIGIDSFIGIYIFWFLLGIAWNRNIIKLDLIKSIIILVATSVVLIGASYYQIRYSLKIGVLFGYNSPLIVLQAIAIYNIIVRCKYDVINGNHLVRTKNVLLKIADKSFGIYLIHMFYINVEYKLMEINLFSYKYSVLMLFVLSFLNLTVSYFTTAILKKIPGLKKVL